MLTFLKWFQDIHAVRAYRSALVGNTSCVIAPLRKQSSRPPRGAMSQFPPPSWSAPVSLSLPSLASSHDGLQYRMAVILRSALVGELLAGASV
eukprot:1275829-Rhodomonas_salina.2